MTETGPLFSYWTGFFMVEGTVRTAAGRVRFLRHLCNSVISHEVATAVHAETKDGADRCFKSENPTRDEKSGR